jgi:hypothetical protein
MSIAVLQHKIRKFQVQHDSHNETDQTSSASENQLADIKTEDDPVSVTFPVLKAEREVSCMSVANKIM